MMLVVTVLCAFFEESARSADRKRKIFMLALVPMCLLIALRSENVGTDTPNYIRAFYTVRDGTPEVIAHNLEGMEVGYLYLNKLLSKIWGEAQIVFIAVGVIAYVSIYRFVNATARNRSLALLFFICLGFFQFSLTGTRQTLAICILLWAYPYMKQRKLLKFAGVVALAYCFHKSAILFFMAYSVANMRLTQKNIALMIVVSIIIFTFADKLQLSMADAMEYNYSKMEETGNGFIFFLIVMLITAFCLYNRHQLLRSNSANLILLNVNFLSMTLWTIRLVSRMAERLSLYFMPYTYVALEEFVTSRPRRDVGVYMFATMAFAVALFYYRMLGQPDLCDYQFLIRVR